MWKRSLLYLLLVQLLISSVLPRTRMRGKSMARLSSSWHRGRNTHSFSHGMNAPHPMHAHGPGVPHLAASGSSGNSFQNALLGGALGAAGGVLAVEAGKAMFHSNKHPVHYLEGDNRRQCSLPLNETAQYNDRPHRIAWTCGRNEVCCGKSCCSFSEEKDESKTKIMAIILGVVLVLLLSCCVVYCVYNLNDDERIDIDDPARYENYTYSDYPKDGKFSGNNCYPDTSSSAAYPQGAYPYNGHPVQDPNYYLPGYPPPYPPAYPQCYPPQSPPIKATPKIPIVHKQQEQQKENA